MSCCGDVQFCTGCGEPLAGHELARGVGLCESCELRVELRSRELAVFVEDPEDRPYIWDLEE